ncbi:MAG: hypothetical protein V1891_05035 [bacterium]
MTALFISCCRKGKMTVKDKIRKEADYILSCQYIANPNNPAYGAINNTQGKPTWISPRENALAILGLLIASEKLNNAIYKERAELAADYLIRVQDLDGAWYNQYSYTTPGDPANLKNVKALWKSPTHAQILYAFHKLGYKGKRYAAMKKGAEYLINCQKVNNKGGNDDGLLCGGKDSKGGYLTQRWTHDNCYGYWALEAAADWADINGEKKFRLLCKLSARKILEGMEEYLYNPKDGIWEIAVDEWGSPLKNPHLPCVKRERIYPSWIQYSPVMLNLPLKRKNLAAIGKWIHQTFQDESGACCEWYCEEGELKLRKYPGLSFQASLAWFVDGSAYYNDALKWAEESGLWHEEGGWIDWREELPDNGRIAENWMRFIDTSFYFIACITKYEFRIE